MHTLKSGNHTITVTQVGDDAFNIDVHLHTSAHHARGVSRAVATRWWKRFKATHSRS